MTTVRDVVTRLSIGGLAEARITMWVGEFEAMVRGVLQ